MTSEMSDSALLRDYVTQRDEQAFAQLMRRHLPMVYSAAVRKLGHDHSAAEDVSQSVFVHLASRGRDLIRHPTLAGWLYVTAARKASEHARQTSRRERREIRPALDTTAQSTEAVWSDVKPFLDEAILELAEADRHALVLRYFEGREFAGVAQNLGVSTDAARMRVTRGLDKLRALLKKRGITSSAVALETFLLREIAEAVPSGLALSIVRAVRSLPASVASASLTASLAKLASATALLLLVTAIGTGAVRLWRASRTDRSVATPAAERSVAEIQADAKRLLHGRARKRPEGAKPDPKEAQALGYLRSALFDTTLGQPERIRQLILSSQMLAGSEGEAIPLFREAFASNDRAVVQMAVEGLGRFGPLSRDFGRELLAALENPELKDDAGLTANRLALALTADDSSVATLIALLERRPDLGSPIEAILKWLIISDQPQLAVHREAVTALLDDPRPEIQKTARAVLAELPEPRPLPTPEISRRLIARFQSSEERERQQAVYELMGLSSTTPELRQALATVARQDPFPPVRLLAEIVGDRLTPDELVRATPSAADRETATRDLLARFGRQEASTPEMLLAVGDGSVDADPVLSRVAATGDGYWNTHPMEYAQAHEMLTTLTRAHDAALYEAASNAYALLTHAPRRVYSLDELGPYFAAMQSALSPGEYAVALRDLKPSLDSYWKGRQFIQPEPTHLPVDLVQVLLVGPYHENRPAYEQMLHALRQIDPNFRPSEF